MIPLWLTLSTEEHHDRWSLSNTEPNAVRNASRNYSKSVKSLEILIFFHILVVVFPHTDDLPNRHNSCLIAKQKSFVVVVQNHRKLLFFQNISEVVKKQITGTAVSDYNHVQGTHYLRRFLVDDFDQVS